jgi:hypothetical protein
LDELVRTISHEEKRLILAFFDCVKLLL